MRDDMNIILFALLRSAVGGKALLETEKSLYTQDMPKRLTAVSNKHDMTHLLAWGLQKNQLLTEKDGIMSNAIMKAVYRYEQLNYELEQLCGNLESAEIDFMPLKGSVIRKYYPEAWMRTSCDIDILVHEKDLDRAVEYLVGNCGYTYEGKGAHDVSLRLNEMIHLELHYTLIGEGWAGSSCEILSDIWDVSVLKTGKAYWYEMTDEMFYFYHIAHMAKHFEQGGCGIKPFVDLWILDGIEGADMSARDELLKKGGLLKFAFAARRLCKMWFGEGEVDPISLQMEDYILRGGVYGNSENRIAVLQQKEGGRLKYALSKIFIPYDTIKFHYPILQKHRWLTPFMEVRRWCKLIFCGHLKRSVKELQYNQNISADKAAKTREFLSNIGL